MLHEGASFIAPNFRTLSLKNRVNQCPRCCANNRESYSLSRRAFLASLVNASIFLARAATSRSEETAQVISSDNPSATPSAPPPSPPKRGKRPTWGYTSENGPSVWHTLSPDWEISETGELQSPIPLSYKTALSKDGDAPDRPKLQTASTKLALRLRPMPNAAQPSLQLEPYIPPPPPFVGDAPPLDVSKPPPPPAVVYMEDTAYALKKIHFHAGSTEHEVGGWSGALETHFCFERSEAAFMSKEEGEDKAASEDEGAKEDTKSTTEIQKEPKKVERERKAPKYLNVAVLGQIADQSEPWLSSVLKNVGMIASEDGSVVLSTDMAKVIPSFETNDVYQYEGSFTTPPCIEGVEWLVLSCRMPVAEDDVNEIIRMQGGKNIRPLQESNGRRVVRFPALAREPQEIAQTSMSKDGTQKSAKP
ncbi:Carbonic anhydrase [Gracilariopsis chorda]|uniref:carbonic anhydrase n=1 Tax=Gracilariopsis chorda TaxID=448386 RepID=A0A2V3IXY3_9FLOR|nr:Carbonic anhydrase [Gracilariopsis chorda]|eukprot:PXF46000.1 Carbonic anhydrase [Gracilariopsis chorda]